MKPRSKEVRAVDLEAIRGEFERWRRRRHRGARIPARLWSLAVEAVHVHGITRTIQTLSLDYYALKRRLIEASEKDMEKPESPAFVELTWPTVAKRTCTVELQGERGRALRVELDGLSAEEVVDVVRGLWSGIE